MKPITQMIRNPKPHPQQEMAITELHKNLVVSAGAGSGKTWVLTERYLEKLNHGIRADEIVAITFTEKAAAEMKERIRSAVTKMARRAKEDEEKRFWQKKRKELNYSMITTIHGFCARLLRDHPLEAGVDPHFQVLDGTEASLLLQETIQEMVEKALEKGDERSRLLYAEFSSSFLLQQVVYSLYESLKTYHVSDETVIKETEKSLFRRKEKFLQARSRLFQLFDALEEEFALLEKGLGKKRPPTYLDIYRRWRDQFRQYSSLIETWDGTYTDAYGNMMENLLAGMWRKAGSDQFKRLHGELKETLQTLLLFAEAPHYVEVVKALVSLVEEVTQSYETVKRSRYAVDFSDLETLTVKLLTEHHHVVEKWQKKIKYLMVDEFQDTNSLQKAIFDLLSSRGEKINLFVVGDGKQSIYKFRGADVEVFQQIGEHIKQHGGESVSLQKNFRTQQRLIAYMNDFFSRLMIKVEGDKDFYVTYEPLEAQRCPEHTQPTVELLGYCWQKENSSGDEEEEEESWRQIEAARIAGRIKEMVKKGESLIWRKEGEEAKEKPSSVQYGDIAILLSARTHMHVYEQALYEQGIPYVVVGGRQFYQKQEILDVLNLLKLIQNSEDEIALLGFLRSPFVHLNDETLFWLTRNHSLRHAFYSLEIKPETVTDEEWQKLIKARTWLSQWKFLRLTEGVYAVLHQVLEDTGFPQILLSLENGQQRLANVMKFLDMVKEWVDHRGYELYDFIQHMKVMLEKQIQEEEASVIEDRGNAVILMTIHASKGLEFPVVVLPDLQRDLLKGGGAFSRAIYRPNIGLGIQLNREESKPIGDGMFDELKEEEKSRELQEARRLLYVAMTRARDYLLLVGSQKVTKRVTEEYKNNWLDWIVKHLGYQQLSELKGSHQPCIEAEGWSMKLTWELSESGENDEENDVPHDIPEDMTDIELMNGFMSLGEEDEIEKDPGEDADGVFVEFPLLKSVSLPETNHFHTLSVTALMNYFQCPRLFYIQNILGIQLPIGSQSNLQFSEVPYDDKDGDTSSSKETLLSQIDVGNMVHHVLEKLDHPQEAEELIRHELLSYGLNTGEIKRWTEEIKPYIDRYINSPWNPINYRKVQSEIPFLYRLGEQTISGVMDKMLKDEEGKATILDFKTNHFPVGQKERADHLEKLVNKYKTQAILYTLVVKEILQYPVKETILYFLEIDHPYAISVDDANLASEKRRLEDAIARIKGSRQIKDYPSCHHVACPCKKWSKFL
ncbi:UvrD-helicase domain-containing protein [Microaerobacter geothermalis]|uniref:UvrD-helicase domain-containing protein n=1 Tax=Microaerobacter geothermalis TaxID=674972 RepID=UPI001F1D06DA|nr:UvrD-helicase domain-containing protein [Microaerobacter geothermalis]MCF6094727.1 UvrD-helicase domain-containing protein [Microaerobacter geothermalis]